MAAVFLAVGAGAQAPGTGAIAGAVRDPRGLAVVHAAVSAFGFGGQNCVLVLRAP